jgi:hypothetical protein
MMGVEAEDWIILKRKNNEPGVRLLQFYRYTGDAEGSDYLICRYTGSG